jgi:hypothetical protein
MDSTSAFLILTSFIFSYVMHKENQLQATTETETRYEEIQIIQ